MPGHTELKDWRSQSREELERGKVLHDLQVVQVRDWEYRLTFTLESWTENGWCWEEWCFELSAGEGACIVRVLKNSVHYNSDRPEREWERRNTVAKLERLETVRGRELMRRIVLDSILSESAVWVESPPLAPTEENRTLYRGEWVLCTELEAKSVWKLCITPNFLEAFLARKEIILIFLIQIFRDFQECQGRKEV